MKNFDDASKALLSGTEQDDPVGVMLTYYGHYRLDRLNQEVLEDLRQRLARRGVSLAQFRGECLPFIKKALNQGLEEGAVKQVPMLFEYQHIIKAARRTFQRHGLDHMQLRDLRDDYIIRQMRNLPVEAAAERCGFESAELLLSRYADFLPSSR